MSIGSRRHPATPTLNSLFKTQQNPTCVNTAQVLTSPRAGPIKILPYSSPGHKQQAMMQQAQIAFENNFIGKMNQLLNTNKERNMSAQLKHSDPNTPTEPRLSAQQRSPLFGGIGSFFAHQVFGDKLKIGGKSLDRALSPQNHFVNNHWKRSKIQGLSTQHEFAREKLKQKIEAISYTLSVVNF